MKSQLLMTLDLEQTYWRSFLAAAERGQGLAAAGADAGYADQAHLTRDVRALTGVTPKRLLDERLGPAGPPGQPGAAV